MPRLLIVICGPTASGKTGLSVEIAEMLETEIVSADSRQVYREIPLGTAAPSPEQMRRIPHHLVGHRSIHDYYSASIFESESIALIGEILAKREHAILSGGSGLYIRAACEGIDNLPDADQEVRQKLLEQYRKEGLPGIRNLLRSLDPGYYRVVDLKNHRRILKALEVTMVTGKPYSSFLTHQKKDRAFRILKIGLMPERETLYQRISRRTDLMFDMGLEKEAETVYPFRHLNALNTVGYREMFSYFDGLISAEEARLQIKKNTRNYARKQITWFKKDGQVHWFDPSNRKGIRELILKHTGHGRES